MIYMQEMYPGVFEMIQFNEILGDFNEALFIAQRRLLVLFQQNVAQETILWGIASHLHLLIVQKNQTELPMNMIKCLLGYISSDKYHCICQIISTFARLEPSLPSEIIKEIHVTCFQSIGSLPSQTVGSIIYSLMEYLMSPKVSPAVHSLEIGNIMIEGITAALHTRTQITTPHRVEAVEAAEAYLGTYFSMLGTEEALYEHIPGNDLNEQTAKWFSNGNTLYSVIHNKEEEIVIIQVRNSVGRYEWTFKESEMPGWIKTIEIYEELGEIEEGDGIIEEKIHSDINDLSQMIDEIPNELVWDFPEEIKSKEVYDNFMKITTKECVEVRKKLENIPREKIEIHPDPRREKVEKAISSPLTTGILMTELFFIESLSITSQLTILPTHEKFRGSIAQLDKTPVKQTHPIGLIYIGKGNTEENKYNTNGVSGRYIGFSGSLGEQMNINNYQGYTGGIDITGIDGTTVMYYKSSTRECIYHESARMMSQENEERRRQIIGKDNVMLIWNENVERKEIEIEEKEDGKCSVKVVIYPGMNGIDTIEIYRKKDVKVFGPLVDNMVVPESLLGQLVRETAINADECSNERNIGDNQLLPFLQRKAIIEEIIPKNPTYSQKGYLSTLSVFLDEK